ncbi:putative ATP/GTP-binding protein [hydrothermal vent metagenome]|uniref:Putative ATP/GTP-binding protein n=1 Tax=hydrothermal vent metagenome TaxID=652676 RepID=A0A3B0WRP3_9ZZZZ
MNDFKIIFTGPVGSGKTTAIATLSDEPPVCTNQDATDITKERKPKTTVAMDYGTMLLDGKEKIHFYGTPGQERFNFMWDILTINGLGLILLLDNTGSDPLNDMEFFLTSFKDYIGESSVAIGITQTDIAPLLTMERYQQKLKDLGFNCAIFEVDARNFNDMSQLVQALLFTIDPGLEYSA